jgi:multidrug efflux system membrane fusion protein
MGRIIVSGLVVLATAAGILWLATSATAQKAPVRQAPQAVPVVVAEAVRKEMPIEISTIGRVQTIASVAVRSRIDGVIAAVDATDGQEVKAGDVLFSFDSRALEAAVLQAKATLARDRAQLENAKRDVERLRPLSQRDFVSRQQFDQTQTNAAMLAATVQADEAQLQSAEVQLSYATIRAPIDGRLGTINFKLGNSIKANDTTPLVTLNQIRPIYVAFSVPQAQFPAIRAAEAKGPLEVDAAASGDADAALRGKLAYAENAIDPTTNTLSLKATFANEENRLWPGQFVNATLILGIERDAIVVPAEAVQAGQNSPFVFVLKEEDSTVEVRPVTVDRTIGSEAVIAKGVAAGEKVVVNGQIRLENGTKVAVRPADEATPKQQEPAG